MVNNAVKKEKSMCPLENAPLEMSYFLIILSESIFFQAVFIEVNKYSQAFVITGNDNLGILFHF